VGLAGPSGSGKTAFSEKIKSFIPGCTLLSMDNYNDGTKVIDGNFDGATRKAEASVAA
jgi:uridine kinase